MSGTCLFLHSLFVFACIRILPNIAKLLFGYPYQSLGDGIIIVIIVTLSQGTVAPIPWPSAARLKKALKTIFPNRF